MTNDPWATTPEPTERPSWLTNEIEELLKLRNFPIDQNGALMLWQDSKDRLAEYKEMEMDLRKICVAFLVPDKTEGTNSVELGGGYVAKAVVKFNYKPKDNNDAIWAGLEKIERLTNDGKGKLIAERLFSWSPSFLKTEYVTLQEDAAKGDRFAVEALKIIENELIVISEAAPTLDIKPPKAKK
jgi:hypothetical protein